MQAHLQNKINKLKQIRDNEVTLNQMTKSIERKTPIKPDVVEKKDETKVFDVKYRENVKTVKEEENQSVDRLEFVKKNKYIIIITVVIILVIISILYFIKKNYNSETEYKVINSPKEKEPDYTENKREKPQTKTRKYNASSHVRNQTNHTQIRPKQEKKKKVTFADNLVQSNPKNTEKKHEEKSPKSDEDLIQIDEDIVKVDDEHFDNVEHEYEEEHVEEYNIPLFENATLENNKENVKEFITKYQKNKK